MKYLIPFVFFTLFTNILIAQNEKNVESEIKKVTIYQEGAEVTREAKVNLDAGKTTLLFKGLTAQLNSETINVNGDHNLTIVSVSHQLDYLNKAKVSDKILNLENRRLSIKDSLTYVDGVLKVYGNERELILHNKNLGGEDGVDITELKSASDFYRSRLSEIEKKTIDLKREKAQLQINYQELSMQLMELNFDKDAPTSTIKVVVNTQSKSLNNVTVKYLVHDAGWTANYDLRVNAINQPMQLMYKAKVYQNSGEDWNKVDLTLSTGNPNISNYLPELETYKLDFNNYYKTQNTSLPKIRERGSPYSVYGRVIDEFGEPLPFVNIMVQGTTIGTTTDFDGYYRIEIPADFSNLTYSYIGYESVTRNAQPGEVNVQMTESDMQLEEVVVMSSRSSSIAGVSSKTIRSRSTVMQVPLAIAKRETSTEFEIEIPYTIPSDNEQYDVSMVEYQVPTSYSYTSIPKLSQDAYLTANIPDWNQYEMIDGNANIFFEGIYQGQTYLDLQSFDDTLALSIGRDQDIAIEREVLKELAKKSTLGSQIKDLKAWKITIKNNKSTNIELNVKDQFPLSVNSDIKVEQLESTGANLNEDTGELSWKLNLAPGEKKELIIKYEVKYPKSRNLIVD